MTATPLATRPATSVERAPGGAHPESTVQNSAALVLVHDSSTTGRPRDAAVAVPPSAQVLLWAGACRVPVGPHVERRT
jgi:hypothetical protein